jgi:hypothetical protein
VTGFPRKRWRQAQKSRTNKRNVNTLRPVAVNGRRPGNYCLFGSRVVGRRTLHDAPHAPQNKVCSPKCSFTATVVAELHVGHRGSFGLIDVGLGSAVRSFLFISRPQRGEFFTKPRSPVWMRWCQQSTNKRHSTRSRSLCRLRGQTTTHCEEGRMPPAAQLRRADACAWAMDVGDGTAQC